jgi:2'-5' RNA ligase
METISAAQYPQVYVDLGLDTEQLGCIMADTEPIMISSVIDQADLYYSEDQEFTQGIVSESVPHVTLLYGLLSSGPAMQKHVDAVMASWSLAEVQIEDVTAFGANDSPYACLVARLVQTPALMEANARLRLLPHIDTFSDYTPHITLAYVDNDAGKVADYVDELTRRLARTVVAVKGINYGK